MKKTIIEKAHDFILKMPSFLEKIVAAILGELQPQLSAMGIPVELGKKVYPNDPCPCGSGKKYKKCCGR